MSAPIDLNTPQRPAAGASPYPPIAVFPPPEGPSRAAGPSYAEPTTAGPSGVARSPGPGPLGFETSTEALPLDPSLAGQGPGAGAIAVGERGLPSPAPSPAPSVAGVKRRAPVDGAEPDTEGKGKGKEKEKDEDQEEEEEETKKRKRVHLKTDEEKAQLVNLCIKHFARYPEGREKFWGYMKDVWAKEMKTQAPSFKEFMTRHEKIWKKELEKDKTSRAGGKTVVHSETTKAGLVWLRMVEDLAEEKRKKKKESSFFQRTKDTAAALRTKMTPTFSQRRGEEQRALEEKEEREEEEESTESEPGAETASMTTDRVLSSLREGTVEMLTQMNNNLQDEARRKDRWEEKWLAVEEKKSSLVQKWLEAQQELGCRLPSVEKPQVVATTLESEREKLKQDITAEVTANLMAKFEEKFAAQQNALENIQAMLRSGRGE